MGRYGLWRIIAYQKIQRNKKSPSILDEDIQFALFGGEGEITDEMWEAVKEYAQFIKDKTVCLNAKNSFTS